MSSSRQLVAIMFTDIVGYTAQMDRDEVKAFELLKKNRLIQKPLIEQYNGKFLKEMGDGVLASFPTVTEAVNCAQAIQTASGGDTDLVLRIGIHQGEVVFEGEDVFGSGVNIASRIEALADPGGILVSEAVYQNVKNQQDIRLEFFREERLKNVEEPIKLYRISPPDKHKAPKKATTIDLPESGSAGVSLWDELMDRNVLRAGLAYVVLAWLTIHILDLVKGWLTLPTWVGGLVFVLLIIGFPIGIVLAWFYERSPEGFVRIGSGKSEKNPFSRAQKKPFTSNLIIAGLALIVLITYLFPQNADKETTLYGYKLGKESIDRSIAVLPFKNLSEEKGSQYFSDGVMDAILSNLSKMGDLDVISRTSTEQYRDSPKSIPQIGEELAVTNILEGSVQRYGNQVRIIVQLINAPDDKHIWSENYDRELIDVFAVQSEIAEKIAQALRTELTQEELDNITKIPTTNLSAYDLFLKGQENLFRYGRTDSLHYYDLSTEFLNQAIQQDPNFAQAYGTVAMGLVLNNRRSETLDISWMDTALIISNKAIALDPNLALGYAARGSIFAGRNMLDEAIVDMEKAIRLNPNSTSAIIGLGYMYMRKREYTKAFVALRKGERLDPGNTNSLRNVMSIGFLYQSIGNSVKAKEYFRIPIDMGIEEFSPQAYGNLAWLAITNGNLQEGLEYSSLGLSLQPNRTSAISAHAESLYLIGDFEQSKKLYEQIISQLDSRNEDDYNFRHRYAYVLWKLGEKEKATEYFEEQIYYCQELIKLKNWYGTAGALYDLAGIYSFLGKTELAVETLGKIEHLDAALGNYAMVDPLYENIANLPETQQILEKHRQTHVQIREEISAVEGQEELDWLKSK